MTDTITFTPEKRDALRKAYNAADENGDDSFVFNGDEFVTDYAKYLLQYLDTRLPAAN